MAIASPSSSSPSPPQHKVYLKMDNPSQKQNGIFVVPSNTQPGKVYPFPRIPGESKEEYEERARKDPMVLGKVKGVSLDPNSDIVVVELKKKCD